MPAQNSCLDLLALRYYRVFSSRIFLTHCSDNVIVRKFVSRIYRHRELCRSGSSRESRPEAYLRHGWIWNLPQSSSSRAASTGEKIGLFNGGRKHPDAKVRREICALGSTDWAVHVDRCRTILERRGYASLRFAMHFRGVWADFHTEVETCAISRNFLTTSPQGTERTRLWDWISLPINPRTILRKTRPRGDALEKKHKKCIRRR